MAGKGTQNTKTILKGGCLCGQVRFETDRQPQMIRHCHCEMCRKFSGSAFGTGLMFRADEVHWTGKMQNYESSPGILRVFCSTCGSSLAFRATATPQKDCVLLGAVDDPSLIQVDGNLDHMFGTRELHWIRIDDGLPREEGVPGGLYEIR